MYNREYENKLGNKFLKLYNTADHGNLLMYGDGFRTHQENAKKGFDMLLDEYKDYIIDNEKVIADIWGKIKTIEYVNRGKRTKDEWTHNKHEITINGFEFEYSTGMGINCTPTKNTYYNIYKLIFDCIFSLLDEQNSILDGDADDFCENFGYDESVEKYKKGLRIYDDIKRNRQKVSKIWGMTIVYSLHDIVEL